MPAILRLDFAGRSTALQPSDPSFVHLMDFARIRKNNGKLLPPHWSDIAPSIHAFVTFLNTFARRFARITEWATVPPQYSGENSLSHELMAALPRSCLRSLVSN